MLIFVAKKRSIADDNYRNNDNNDYMPCGDLNEQQISESNILTFDGINGVVAVSTFVYSMISLSEVFAASRFESTSALTSTL